jgi:hypothetical protein
MADDAVWVGKARMMEHRCHVCYRVIDAVTSVSNMEPQPGESILPQPGDLTACVYCWSIGVWEADGSIRTATPEECEDVPDWVRLQIARVQSPSKPS